MTFVLYLYLQEKNTFEFLALPNALNMGKGITGHYEQPQGGGLPIYVGTVHSCWKTEKQRKRQSNRGKLRLPKASFNYVSNEALYLRPVLHSFGKYCTYSI